MASSRRTSRSRPARSIYDALKRKGMSGPSLRDFRRQFSSLALSEANLRRVIREAPLHLLLSLADYTGVDLHREDPRPYMTKLTNEIAATLASRRAVKPWWSS